MTVLSKNTNLFNLVKSRQLPEILCDTDLTFLIPGTPDKRSSLIKRYLAKKELIQIRRGVYILGELYRTKTINTFELAPKIYAPSYISFESALSHWGLIPEAVYQTTSASFNRSQNFATPFGNFTYRRIPCNPFLCQVMRIEKNDCIYLIASPLKALCDWVYYSKQNWDLKSLLEFLRIEDFKNPPQKVLKELKEAYRSLKVIKFLNSIKDFHK